MKKYERKWINAKSKIKTKLKVKNKFKKENVENTNNKYKIIKQWENMNKRTIKEIIKGINKYTIRKDKGEF